VPVYPGAFPKPKIAGSAVVLGEMHVGADTELAQGLVVRAHGAAVSIGNYSAVLENKVVIGMPQLPVRVGQRTVHRDHHLKNVNFSQLPIAVRSAINGRRPLLEDTYLLSASASRVTVPSGFLMRWNVSQR